MTPHAKYQVQGIGIALLLTLAPGIVMSQDRTDAATHPAKTVETQAPAPTESLPAAAVPAPESAALKPSTEEGASPYTIKKGDTLWDISHTFLKDPFLWPFLWKANPSIANPDLIYPGNTLTIPSLAPVERALQAPSDKQERLVEKTPSPESTVKPAETAPAVAPVQSTPKEEAAKPKNTLIIPEEKPVPLVDKHTLLSAGYIEDYKGSDTIVGSPEKVKALFGFDDIVYVSFKNSDSVNIGDKFLIFTASDPVMHPKTKQPVGRLIRGLGVLQVIAKEKPNVLTARIMLSYDVIEIGNLLTPYQEPTLLYKAPDKKTADIAGIILATVDKRSINAQTDIVYLDKGSADGIEAGDRFTVFAAHQEPGYPKRKIGEVQVFTVKERTSTAIVRKSLDTIGKGDIVEYKK